MNFLRNIQKGSSIVGFLLLIALVLVLILCWPFAIIWALNTLFPLLTISYSFWSWLAVVVLNLSYFAHRSKSDL